MADDQGETADQGNVDRGNVAEYFGSMARDLEQMANKSQMPTVAYLFGLAAEETKLLEQRSEAARASLVDPRKRRGVISR